ncbi:MAG: GAF domain-containing protein [Anaerolineae bacterium]|nr:GAF domain-containing protein [Anaerolineae bacterium]
MPIIYFLYGLSFSGLGLAALLQYRRGSILPLHKQLPWLAAFGLAYAGVGWADMFLTSGLQTEVQGILRLLRMILQPLSGLLLLRFGWGMLTQMTPLPSWTRIIPGILTVPLAFIITYAATTFVTPSPIHIPIDIWSRYLLYLPGSIMAGIGFIRQSNEHKKRGFQDASYLMMGAGIAFLTEAFIVGLIVPAAPYGPVSYYNYDRVHFDSIPADTSANNDPFTIIDWLDYAHVLQATGQPIQFWRMLSAVALIFFVVRSLDVFDAIERRRIQRLQEERDLAHSNARHLAESWAEALMKINREIAELKELDAILFEIVCFARKLLNSDYVALGLLEEKQRLMLRCFATSETIIASPTVGSSVQVESELILKVLKAAKPYRTSGEEGTNRLADLCLCTDAIVSEAAFVPLMFNNVAVGVLWSVRTESDPYNADDLPGLERLANQAVIAIQHGLMAAQIQSLAVVGERARIAREMHDGLAQILGYMNLQAQTLEALLKQNKRENLFAEIKQMREAIQTAHADVRENILSLRTTLSTEAGVASAMLEYLDGFSLQTGIDIKLQNHLDGYLGLSPLAEVQLVCILQEALANVRKHAQATEVSITLVRQVGCAHLEISDNGIGFVEQADSQRFGLQTMRERAQQVGGKLSISSKVGQGTTVVCVLPEIDQANPAHMVPMYMASASMPDPGY